MSDVIYPGDERVSGAQHAANALAGVHPQGGKAYVAPAPESEEAAAEASASAPDATPAAVKAADEAGVDLADVEGSGKDGRVTKGDVDAHDSQDATSDDAWDSWDSDADETVPVAEGVQSTEDA